MLGEESWRGVSDTNAANLGDRDAILRSDGVLAVESRGHACQRTTARTPSLRRVLRDIVKLAAFVPDTQCQNNPSSPPTHITSNSRPPVCYQSNDLSKKLNGSLPGWATESDTPRPCCRDSLPLAFADVASFAFGDERENLQDDSGNDLADEFVGFKPMRLVAAVGAHNRDR